MKKIYIQLLFLLFALRLSAQDGFKIVQYTANDGLPSSLTFNVFQDSRDFLWINTDAGLSRFDGKRFMNYAAPDGLYGNRIMAIAESRRGHLWIGTGAGLYRFNGHSFRKEAGALGVITAIKLAGNQVWIGTKTGLHVWEAGKIMTYTPADGLPSAKITCLLPLDDGSILIGTGKGISRYKNGFTDYWVPPTNTDEGHVMAMAAEDNGRFWFCTLSGEIYFKEKGQVSKPPFDSTTSFPRSIIISGDTVLIAHERHFSVFEDGEYQGDFEGFIPKEKFRNGMIDAIRDHEGNFWLATVSGLVGVKKTNIQTINMPLSPAQAQPVPHRSKTPVTGVDRGVENIFRLSGDSCLYLSNSAGIYTICNDSIRPAFAGKPHQLGDISVFNQARDGSFFFGSSLDALVRYRNGKFERLEEHKYYVSSIQNNDELWLGGYNTLSVYKGGALQSFRISSDTAYYYFKSMARYKGGILIGTQSGLLFFKNGSFEKLAIPFLEPPVVINDILQHSNNTFLLATMGYGLVQIRIENNKVELLRALTTKSGLNTNFIHRVLLRDSIIWLTGLNGVYKISQYLTEPSIEYLNREDGLLNNDWTYSPIAADASGYMYIGGSEGLMKFHATISEGTKVKQKTYISDVDVNSTDFEWNIHDSLKSFSGMPAFYRFEPTQNSLTFYLTSINMHRPSRTKYEYILHGYSEVKTVTGSDYVTFNNLPPGRYVFKVRSTSNQKLTNEKYAIFSFEIKTPFWKTWWFRLLLLISVAAIIYAIYRWRLMEQIKKQKNELAVQRQLNETKVLAFQARMNPHFIFNSLNSIQYFITNNDKLGTLNYLSKFARLLRQILDNTAESKITLEKEIEMLQSYIEMEQLRFEQKFDYELAVDPGLFAFELKIPGMVIQPFVENAILHGLLHKDGKGLLKIRFCATNKQVICTVEDNGIGRARSTALNKRKITKHKSYGTEIAISRLKLHDDAEKGIINRVVFEDIMIEGVPAGTKVTVYIPIL